MPGPFSPCRVCSLSLSPLGTFVPVLPCIFSVPFSVFLQDNRIHIFFESRCWAAAVAREERRRLRVGRGRGRGRLEMEGSRQRVRVRVSEGVVTETMTPSSLLLLFFLQISLFLFARCLAVFSFVLVFPRAFPAVSWLLYCIH